MSANTVSQKEKAKQLAALHNGTRILVLPNAWDAASARLFEEAGLPVVATTSAGLANSLGYPDGQYAPLDEVLFVVRRIVQTVRVPVTVDIEAGYGSDSVESVVRTIEAVLDTGAVGFNLEDAEPGTGALADVNLQIEKIQALRALATERDIPFVINARTDAYHLQGLGEDEKFRMAVERANAYRAAGADCLFVPFVTYPETIARLAESINGPLNVLAMPGTPPAGALEVMGVRRVSSGSGPNRATLALVREIARELLNEGTYRSFTERSIPYVELNALFKRGE
jgi:2-methylisocitrate lyase-like PEP mutase family enzyme